MTWNLARGEEFLPDVSLDELKKQITAEKERQPRLRLLVALNRKQNKSIGVLKHRPIYLLLQIAPRQERRRAAGEN